MPKKVFSLFILILFFAVPLVAEEPGAVPVDKKVGYALLDAIADEIINLHLYLDNIEMKEKLRKAWDEKMAAPAKKKE
jgi:hypothetical protein